MKYALITLSFVASTAFAAPPPGCYSTNDNPLQCWPTTIAQSYFETLEENVNWYGFMVGNLIWDYKTCREILNDCSDTYDATYDVAKSLRRRLRLALKKCGSRCR